MSYTPAKGSPQPPVPGANALETAALAVENLIAKIPLSAGLTSEIAIVEAAIGTAIGVVDPDGQKGTQRSAILNAAQELALSGDATQVAQGVAEATTFAQDKPSHPTPWERWSRWICVQAGAPDPLPNGA